MSTRNCNGSSVIRKPPTQEEQPKFQFRGVFLPAEVVQRLVDGELNRTDLLVLTLVEALVEPRGRDCWASNDYIAASVGAHPVNVSRSITRLKDTGLLVTSGNGKARTMRTAWSRCVPEAANLSENAKDNLSENAKVTPFNSKALEPSPPRAGERERRIPCLDGDTPTRKPAKPTKAGAVQKTPGYRLAREVLYPAVRDANRLVVLEPNLPAWGRSLDKLLARVKIEEGLNGSTFTYVKSVLEDHTANLLAPFQPEAFCGEAVARKFDQLVAAKRRREQTAAEESGTGTRPCRLLISRDVTEQLPNNRVSVRPARKEVTRDRKGEWVTGDNGRRYWEAEPIENLLREGERLIRVL